MPTFAIVAEGPDDLAAIRELLRRAGGDVGGTIHEANRSPLKAKLRGQDVHVWAARGKKADVVVLGLALPGGRRERQSNRKAKP